jgi:hypothetical protein
MFALSFSGLLTSAFLLPQAARGTFEKPCLFLKLQALENRYINIGQLGLQ